MNATQASKQPTNTTLDIIEGVITTIKPVNQFAQGHVQRVILDRVLAVKLWNHDVLDEKRHLGATMVIEASHGRTGPTGLRMVEQEYKGRTIKYLNVSENCTVTVGGDVPDADEDAEPEVAPEDEPPAQMQAPATWREIGRHIERLAAAYAVCFSVAYNKVAPEVYGLCNKLDLRTDLETIRQIATTLFIERNRSGAALPLEPYQCFGQGTMLAPKPPSKPQPSPEAAQPADTDNVPF